MPKRWIIVLSAAICCLALVSLLIYSTSSPLTKTPPTSMADLGLVLLDDPVGVSVLAVQDKSLADRANIHPGDILLKANDASFADVEQLENQLLFGDLSTIRLQLLRGTDEYVTTVLNLQ